MPTDPKTPEERLSEAKRAVVESREHLLELHANCDKGTYIKKGILRDSFVSPCEEPHECWNRLEVAEDHLATLALLVGRIQQHRDDCDRDHVPRRHAIQPTCCVLKNLLAELEKHGL